MEAVAIVGMFALSLAVGVGGTTAIFVPMFSLMSRARAAHDAAHGSQAPEALTAY